MKNNMEFSVDLLMEKIGRLFVVSRNIEKVQLTPD